MNLSRIVWTVLGVSTAIGTACLLSAFPASACRKLSISDILKHHYADVAAKPIAYDPETPDEYLQKRNAELRAFKSRTHSDDSPLQANIVSGRAPRNFRAVIDAALSGQLIDPASRRVTYGAMPGPGAVCGMVNSKNRLGGYVGNTPFYALFDANGSVAKLRVFQGSMYDINMSSTPTDERMMALCHFFQQ